MALGVGAEELLQGETLEGGAEWGRVPTGDTVSLQTSLDTEKKLSRRHVDM